MSIRYEPYLETDTTTKTVKTNVSNNLLVESQVYLMLDQKLKHESLILAQDERWRRA